MIKGKLENGFEFSIDEDVFDDMELVDDIRASQGKDPSRISDVVDKILGESKYQLYDLIRNKKGKVPLEKVADAIGEIMEKSGEQGKN